MKVAILGGSFDPPHRAHVQILEYLLEKKKFDEIWVVPTSQNPFKKASADYADRVRMCELAFGKINQRIKVLQEDINSRYTIDLVRHLLKNFPGTQFTFVGGSDLKEEIQKWKEADELQKLISFEFLPRPPDKDSPFLPISSTEIRELACRGEPVQAWVPEAVEKFIRENRLYLKENP